MQCALFSSTSEVSLQITCFCAVTLHQSTDALMPAVSRSTVLYYGTISSLLDDELSWNNASDSAADGLLILFTLALASASVLFVLKVYLYDNL